MESVIIQSGPCGYFQVLHVFLTQSTRFVLAWSVNFMMFGNFNPGWRCIRHAVTNIPGNVTDWSTVNGYNDTSRDLQQKRYSAMNTTAFSNSPNSSLADFIDNHYFNNQTHPGLGTKYSYDDTCKVIDQCQSIEFNPSSSTIVSEFGLVCDKTWIISFIIFMQFIGMFTGSLFWGQIGERFGRKISVYGSTALLGVCNALSVFCQSWEAYLVCSVFIGVGGVGILTCVPVFSMEFLSAKWRGMFASLPVWNLSSCCFAAVVIALKNWWHIHIVNAIITAIVCLGFFWVPESPRWLAVHGKKEQAVVVVEKIARYNRKPVPEMDAIETFPGDENSNVKTYTYLDLFRTKSICIIVIKLSISLIIAICTYNTLGFGVYSLPGNFYINFIISSCSEIPGVILVGFLANRIGRRWTGFVLSLIQAVCFSSIVLATLLIEDEYLSELVIKVMAFVARGGAVSVLSLISPIAVELLPTVVRSLGLGFILMMSRLGGLIAPFLLPHDRESFAVCFIVLTVMAVVACLDFLSLPETNKKPLRDTLREGKDGDGGCGGGGGNGDFGSGGNGGGVGNGADIIVLSPLMKKDVDGKF